jgi:hypothetical protein
MIGRIRRARRDFYYEPMGWIARWGMHINVRRVYIVRIECANEALIEISPEFHTSISRSPLPKAAGLRVVVSETAAYVQVTCRLPGFPVSVTSPWPADLAVRRAQAMHHMRKVGTVAQ